MSEPAWAATNSALPKYLRKNNQSAFVILPIFITYQTDGILMPALRQCVNVVRHIMEKQLLTLLESHPTIVNWTDIVDFVNFDERRSAIDCLGVNTIGVSEGFIEFIPDNEPPLREEVFCWIWAIRPDLSKDLLSLDISENFRILLNSYIDNDMNRFWNQIN